MYLKYNTAIFIYLYIYNRIQFMYLQYNTAKFAATAIFVILAC